MSIAVDQPVTLAPWGHLHMDEISPFVHCEVSSPEFQTTLVSVSGTPSFLDDVSLSSLFLWVPILFLLCFSIFRTVLVNDESNITCTPMDAFHSPALPAC